VGHRRVTEDRKRSNPVAKYSKRYNLAHTFEDRKRKEKSGKVKHKGSEYDY
jgi:hypothetical protein